MPETRELTYEGGGLEVHLVIGAATVLAGMKRALLQGRVAAYLDEHEPEEGIEATARNLLARFLYPDLLASLVQAEGLDADMDVETFLALPEQLTDAWQNLAYELNLHWYPFRREPEDVAEKNAPVPSSASASSS